MRKKERKKEKEKTHMSSENGSKKTLSANIRNRVNKQSGYIDLYWTHKPLKCNYNLHMFMNTSFKIV